MTVSEGTGAAGERDPWAEWLLRGRDGDDREARERMRPILGEFRDNVLDHASVGSGDVVLDVGAGDGLVGFGALDRVGLTGRVIFSDVSALLLDECRRLAAERGVLDRCEFVRASAEDLRGVPAESVDVVTARSVLIYVPDKGQAFREFVRVLKPKGRLSIFEPINSFTGPQSEHVFFGIDLEPVAHLAAKLRKAYKRTRVPRAEDPMLNFDERDLLRMAWEAGFTDIHLEYHAEIGAPKKLVSEDWTVFKEMSPNPLAPTFGQLVEQALTPEERQEFETFMVTLLRDSSTTRSCSATAYLWATRAARGS